MNKSLVFILITIMLDSIGIGLMMPIIPDLLRSISHDVNVTSHYGVFLALYAFMQFIFSPILGALSDRFGRRPILLISLAGAAVDYLIMAFAPNLIILYIGRIISGITGANMAVATAYIADISEEEIRAKRYGFMHACFGLGFVAGPLIGGVLGSIDLHYPFLMAAAFNGLNFVLGYFVLPESHAKEKRRAVEFKKLNPFASLMWVTGMKSLIPLLIIFTILNLIGQFPMSLWAIYTHDKLAWDMRMIGYSFAAFGIFHAAAQAFLTGPITAKLGSRNAILLGIGADVIGLSLLGFVTQGWMVFALIPFFCISGVAFPAVQALISNHVEEEVQGELQGTLVSLISVVSVIGPLLATGGYALLSDTWTGAIWLCAASIYLFCLPILFGKYFKKT